MVHTDLDIRALTGLARAIGVVIVVHIRPLRAAAAAAAAATAVVVAGALLAVTVGLGPALPAQLQQLLLTEVLDLHLRASGNPSVVGFVAIVILCA